MDIKSLLLRYLNPRTVMNIENFILEIKEATYDRNQLLEIFNNVKYMARVKGLPWRDKPTHVAPVDFVKCVVIQYGEYMMLDQSKTDLSCNLLEHPYIKELVSPFKFSHIITPNNVDIIWYRPGFVFQPHVDHYASSTLMWPIIPANGGTPVDFYHKEGIEVKAGEYNNIVSDSDICYTHYYSTDFPTIFNSHVIHGIRPVEEERAYLRLRINEDFNSIKEKFNNGTLLND